MEKLVDAGSDLDEFNRVIGLLGDVIDGLESAQVLHADPGIESQLADLRYVKARLAKLLVE